MEELQMAPKPWVSILKRSEVEKKRKSGIILQSLYYNEDSSECSNADEAEYEGEIGDDNTIDYIHDLNTIYLEEDNSETNTPIENRNWQKTSYSRSPWNQQLDDPNLRYPRPPLSYSLLVAVALRNSPEHCLFLKQIYQFICVHFPWFNSQCLTKWKSSVRHVLAKRSAWFRKKEWFHQMGQMVKNRFACWEVNSEECPQIDFDIALILSDSVNKKRLKKSVRFKKDLSKLLHGEFPLNQSFYDKTDFRNNSTSKTRRLTQILNKWKKIEQEEVDQSVDLSEEYYKYRQEILNGMPTDEHESGNFDEPKYGAANGTFQFINLITSHTDSATSKSTEPLERYHQFKRTHGAGSIVLNENALMTSSKPPIILDVASPELEKYRIKDPVEMRTLTYETKKTFPKPVCSYGYLVALALRNSPNGSLTEGDIFKFIINHFPYFKSDSEGCWKNAVTLHLRFNKCFIKREDDEDVTWSFDHERLLTRDKYTEKLRVYNEDTLKKAMRFPNLLESLERGEGEYEQFDSGFKEASNSPKSVSNLKIEITDCHVSLDKKAIDEYFLMQVKFE